MFRKSPEAAREWTPDSPAACAARQAEILNSAFKMLKPGGTLAYSTCSFSKEENEDVIALFHAQYPDAEIVDLPDDPTFFRPKTLKEAVYLLPNRFYGEGQFICLIKKPGVHVPDRLAAPENELVATKYRGFLEHYGLVGRANEVPSRYCS